MKDAELEEDYILRGCQLHDRQKWVVAKPMKKHLGLYTQEGLRWVLQKRPIASGRVDTQGGTSMLGRLWPDGPCRWQVVMWITGPLGPGLLRDPMASTSQLAAGSAQYPQVDAGRARDCEASASFESHVLCWQLLAEAVIIDVCVANGHGDVHESGMWMGSWSLKKPLKGIQRELLRLHMALPSSET